MAGSRYVADRPLLELSQRVFAVSKSFTYPSKAQPSVQP